MSDTPKPEVRLVQLTHRKAWALIAPKGYFYPDLMEYSSEPVPGRHAYGFGLDQSMTLDCGRRHKFQKEN